MPLTDAQRQKRRYARQKVIRDLIRAQEAGVEDPLGRRKAIVERAILLGLPESDGNWFFNTMMRNGWKFSGIPITDWAQTMDNFHRNQFFPSMRK